MAVKFLGWGKWGGSLVDALTGYPCGKIQEEDLGFGHFPDPVAAYSFFLAASRANQDERLEGAPNLTRIHFLNMGENFSSGAMSAFFREAPAYKETIDIVIAYMPPPGTNPDAVGRFLANALGNSHFADALVLIDGCAGIFCDHDEWAIKSYAAETGKIFYALERGSCFVPLLLRMRKKVFSIAFSEITPLTVSSSLLPLWDNVSVGHQGPMRTDTCEFLAFSVSTRRNMNLASIFERNFNRNNFLYLPFLRAYEWQDTIMPAPLSDSAAKNFAGIFCAGQIPARAVNSLYDYYEACWPAGKKGGAETLNPSVKEWMRRALKGGLHFTRVQDFELLQTAMKKLNINISE